MKSPLIVALLALLVSAAAFAFAISLVTPASHEPRESASALPAVAAPDLDLVARLEALAKENRELRERLNGLESRPVAVERVPVTDGLASREDLDLLRDEILAALASRVAAPESPAFKEQVADTLAEIRKEEAVEKVRAYQDGRSARLEADVAKIGEWLELSPTQSSEIRRALLAQYEREAEVRRLWEEGADPELLGERKRADGEEFDADLARFLTLEQRELFWAGISGGGK